MKTWPSPAARADARQPRRRIPPFHPVPVASRRDGWTPERQAEFVGMLAETRSVEGACRAVCMGKESAYRLRKRPGAAGFAAAWDAALGKPHAAVDLASAKSTGLGTDYRLRAGLMVVVMERGRYSGSYWKDDDNALLQHLAQLDRAAASGAPAPGKPRRLEATDASSGTWTSAAPAGSVANELAPPSTGGMIEDGAKAAPGEGESWKPPTR